MATTNNSINSVLIGQTSKSAFGEMLVVEPSSVIQLQFPYIVNTDLVSTAVTGSGTVTHSAPFCVLSTTATTASSASFSSIKRLHYRTGQGCAALFTSVFTLGTAGSQQYVGVGNTSDGFFFGYNGVNFGILHRNNSSDTWIQQGGWNGDNFDGTGASGITLDFTKGNVFKIQYQWLGYGNIFFYIENPVTGGFELVHQIRYPNTSTSTSLKNPTLALYAYVANTTNNTNIVTKIPSFAGFVEGAILSNDIRFGIDHSKTGVTTELNILTLQNKTTFNSISNQKEVILDTLSFTTTGTPDCTFRLKKNVTLGGSPSYADVAVNNSVVSYDTAGTTVASGRQLATFYVNGNNETTINISHMDILLQPGDKLTISATSSGAGIAPAVGVSWRERY